MLSAQKVTCEDHFTLRSVNDFLNEDWRLGFFGVSSRMPYLFYHLVKEILGLEMNLIFSH